eukprot:TRINITY_DN8565_c0_g1_i1.p1 TRINITY_DN8565_c0_g1~~TRINITY_DN8565_c0_g1_i1.p1  ORF type:complete len:175 (+),score=12.74 TRINITY_DN8565_c0_g1_i1:56-580(+)
MASSARSLSAVLLVVLAFVASSSAQLVAVPVGLYSQTTLNIGHIAVLSETTVFAFDHSNACVTGIIETDLAFDSITGLLRVTLPNLVVSNLSTNILNIATIDVTTSVLDAAVQFDEDNTLLGLRGALTLTLDASVLPSLGLGGLLNSALNLVVPLDLQLQSDFDVAVDALPVIC